MLPERTRRVGVQPTGGGCMSGCENDSIKIEYDADRYSLELSGPKGMVVIESWEFELVEEAIRQAKELAGLS